MSNLVRAVRRDAEKRYASGLDFGEWLQFFGFDGNDYPFLLNQTFPASPREEVDSTFRGFVQCAYRTSGIIFACMLVRQLLLKEMRFQFRRFNNGRPGDLFGTADLKLLEEPWPKGTTSDLIARVVQDGDLAGNFFGVRRNNGIRRMRPDGVTIVSGSKTGREIDMEVIGYSYKPLDKASDDEIYMPEEVAHFAPIPDPLARWRGMSWLTPIVREIMADSAATTHKLKFFENGATPNLVVKLDPSIQRDMYDQWVSAFDERHSGYLNAYRTLYLGGGADATVVGSNLKDLNFSETQGAGETRIAAAAGVPPVIVGFSEGLKSATYSNYQQARRRFADGTMRPIWRDIAGSFAPLVKVPSGSQLWYDDRDIPFLQEDQKDAAEIQSIKSKTITGLIVAGYEPDSVVGAVEAEDLTLLVHTGLVPVQLWTPGSEQSEKKPDPEGATPTNPDAPIVAEDDEAS